MNEEKQTITIDGAVGLIWTDSHLTWDPKLYNGITVIDVLPSTIWKPDIFEMRSGDPSSALTQSNVVGARLDSSGTVVWFIPTALNGRCKFDYNNYPFDTAICKIRLANWIYRGTSVDLKTLWNKPYMDFLSNDNPDWNVKDSLMERKTQNVTDTFYPTIKLTLFLARRQPTVQHQLQWIISVIALLLTLGMFWIPADIGQKLTLGCILLVMLTITLVAVESSVKVPTVSLIQANAIEITMFAVVVGIIFEVIIVNLQNIEDSDPPEFVLNIFSGKVAKILLVSSFQNEEIQIEKTNFCDDQDEVVAFKPTKEKPWNIVGQILDRFLFLIYLIVLCSILKQFK